MYYIPYNLMVTVYTCQNEVFSRFDYRGTGACVRRCTVRCLHFQLLFFVFFFLFFFFFFFFFLWIFCSLVRMCVVLRSGSYEVDCSFRYGTFIFELTKQRKA